MRIRTAVAAALAAGLLVPAAAHAQRRRATPSRQDPGKVAQKPKGKGKTRTVCKKQRLQVQDDPVGREQVARPATPSRSRTARTGGRPDQRREARATSSSSATPRSPARSCSRARASSQRRASSTAPTRSRVAASRRSNYKANGFFFVNVVGYTARHLIAAKTGVYGIYAFNSKGGTMRDSEAYYNNDAGFYIGQTPAQAKPIRSIVKQHRLVGQPARLERHEHALRDDHELALLQQRGRDRPERAGLGEVPARGGQRHPRQRDLLEQLRLPQGRAVQDPRGRHRARSSRSAPACCCSAAAATVVEDNQIYGNYARRRRAGRGHPRSQENPQARRPDRQRGARQRVRPQRHRPQRPRPRLRRQRERATASRATPACASRSRPTARRSRRARPAGANVFDAGRVRRDARRSRARTASPQQIRAPHAPKTGFSRS